MNDIQPVRKEEDIHSKCPVQLKHILLDFSKRPGIGKGNITMYTQKKFES
jgi:hypothetical protein